MEGFLFLIIIPTLLFFFSKVSTIATNTLIPNQVLRHNQSLVSESQTFELGFFNPSTSNNQYYLGIWYKNIRIQTVVWVANRNNPLTDSSGILKINNNGNLILLSRNNSIIWSSSSNHSTTRNPIARLLDSGNFVLKYEGGNDDPENYLWQSFDYPSDTVLEGMKFGFNLKTGLSQQLTSWKNQDDPSLGNFTFRIEPHGFPEFILSKGSIEQFRSGPWNGLRFSGEPEMMTKVMPNPMFEMNSKEMYFMFARSNNSVISRFMLTPSGLLQLLRWNERNMEWIIMLTVQKDLCDSYGLCGAYSNCSMSNAPVCNCLKGFTPKSQHDWDGGEWSGGCVRRTPLNCNSNGDGFNKFESVKLPETSGSWVNKSKNLKECEVKCLNNCSCTAYANSDNRGEGSGCVMWFGELVDFRQFNFGGQDLYVRMASSELDINGDSRKRKKPMIVMVSVPVVMGILICCIIWKIKTKKRGTKQKIYYTNESQKDEMDLPLFDFATIATATSNFSSDSKLGQGGFGPVYKGELSNGQEIAVKRLSTNSGQGLNEFKNEVILIAKLQHRNLVRLLGCCIEREEKMLIYEYMAIKSLDFFIFDQARSTLLSWQKRFHIIIGWMC